MLEIESKIQVSILICKDDDWSKENKCGVNHKRIKNIQILITLNTFYLENETTLNTNIIING